MQKTHTDEKEASVERHKMAAIATTIVESKARAQEGKEDGGGEMRTKGGVRRRGGVVCPTDGRLVRAVIVTMRSLLRDGSN